MQPDPFNRRRHTSQAYPVSTFGKPLETAKSGYGRRLQGSPVHAIPLILSGAAGEVVIGDLTAGLWVYGVVVHSEGTGTVALTLREAEHDPVNNPEIELFTALDASTAGFTEAPEEGLMPLLVDRVLTAEVTGGDADEVVRLSLLVVHVTESWF